MAQAWMSSVAIPLKPRAPQRDYRSLHQKQLHRREKVVVDKMLEPEDCLGILSIVRYKTQLLDIIDEAARLSESERRKKAECVELRLEISSLKSDLNAKELELAAVDRTTECGITSENACILSKENDELKATRDNLKNLLESIQARLKHCELERYSAIQELEACKTITRTRDRDMQSSATLCDKFISLQGQAARKFEDLQQALNDVKKERSDVLKKQREMQMELEALKAAVDDYQADEHKYRQHTTQLKEQLIASSASLEKLKEEMLMERERRKELEQELNRSSQRIVELSDSREQLAEALRAAYLGREALPPCLKQLKPPQASEYKLVPTEVERVSSLGGFEELRKCDLFETREGPHTVLDTIPKSRSPSSATSTRTRCPGSTSSSCSDYRAESNMAPRTSVESAELRVMCSAETLSDSQTKSGLDMNHVEDSHVIMFDKDEMTSVGEENVCRRRMGPSILSQVCDVHLPVKSPERNQWILSRNIECAVGHFTGSPHSCPHKKPHEQQTYDSVLFPASDVLSTRRFNPEKTAPITLREKDHAVVKAEVVGRTATELDGTPSSSPDVPVLSVKNETVNLQPHPSSMSPLITTKSIQDRPCSVTGTRDAMFSVHNRQHTEQNRLSTKHMQYPVSPSASIGPDKTTDSADATVVDPMQRRLRPWTIDPCDQGIQMLQQHSDDTLQMLQLGTTTPSQTPCSPVPDSNRPLDAQKDNEDTQTSVQFDCDSLLNAICL
ncbi:UNVERIFIED_CONTAM: hypothetical protein HHA_265455 [Hammondia hammondi]|eukprot:XP_008887181.1 hypothetical protein HHA_265455 [Hammondia hammondi]